MSGIIFPCPVHAIAFKAGWTWHVTIAWFTLSINQFMVTTFQRLNLIHILLLESIFPYILGYILLSDSLLSLLSTFSESAYRQYRTCRPPTPPDKQFSLLIKTVWKKKQLYFAVAYQNHMYTIRLCLLKSIPFQCIIYIWFWYGIMHLNSLFEVTQYVKVFPRTPSI